MLPVKTIKGGSHNFNHNKLPLIGAPEICYHKFEISHDKTCLH